MAQYNEITVKCQLDFVDILIAEFSVLGFDTFLENEQGFITYSEEIQQPSLFNSIKDQYGDLASFSYYIKKIEKQNWNEEWEKNYEPIIVEETCVVKAAFHTNLPSYPIELIITPKMSFGTGHHETTYSMLAEMLTMDFKGKQVMDAGTGTGVLAILAQKQGASKTFAFDIDDWCVENTLENAEVNKVEVVAITASIETLELTPLYDVVLANINKNILLAQMNYYHHALKKDGDLLLSGFYLEDLEDIKQKAEEVGLQFINNRVRNNWTMARFKK